MSTLRTLDYGHLVTGTASQRKRFIQELVAGLGEAGFVKLVNHGFDDQKLSDVFNWVSLASSLLTWKHPMSLPVLSAQSKTFFGQPLEAKNSISSPAGLRPRRGYTGVSVETSSNADPDVSKRGLLRDAKVRKPPKIHGEYRSPA